MSSKQISAKIMMSLNLVCMLITIALLIYSYIQLSDNFFLLFDPNSTIFIVMMTAFILMILHFIYGIIVIRNKKIYHLTLFIILSLIWGCLWILFAQTAQQITPTILGSDCLVSVSNRNLNRFHQNASKILCKTCPCYFSNSQYSNFYNSQELSNLKQNNDLITTTNQSAAVNIMNCSEWNNFRLAKENLIFKILEDKFKCTGWCNTSDLLFFKFTDVNKGRPIQGCFDVLSRKMALYSRIIYITAYLLGVIMFLGMIFMTLLIYDIRKKKQQKQIIYIFSTEHDIIN